MDKKQRAIDIIKKFYTAKEKYDFSIMIKSVCSYFDFMKTQERTVNRRYCIYARYCK